MPQDTKPDTDLRWLQGSWRQPGVSQALVFTLAEVISAMLELARKRASLHIVCTMENPTENASCDCYLTQLSELTSFEGMVELRCTISSMFAAIACEGMLNQFCFFNLGEDLSESIEKLQPTEKLLIAASVLGHDNVKSSHLYELLKKLMAWRNRFAHCHNPDTPGTSLSRNHADFFHDEIQTFEDYLADFPDHLSAFAELSSWLIEKSGHYLVRFSNKAECSSAHHFLKEFKCFRFSRPRIGHIYDFEVDQNTLQSLMAERQPTQS